MKKLTIDEVNPGMTVFHNYKEHVIKGLIEKDNSVVFKFLLIEYKVSVDELFLDTPTIREASEIVATAKEVFDEKFNAKLVNSSVNDLFIKHWKNMCEAETDTYSYDIAFNDFDAFLNELHKVVEKAKSLRVSNVPLLKTD